MSESAWSIGITVGTRLDQLQAGISCHPLFKLKELERFGGFAAADPFALYKAGTWYVFFEMLKRAENAVIAVASSSDLIGWNVLGVCLTEKHHLSYPCIFEHEGSIYMMPESKSARRVDLYRAVDFPMQWERCATLARGRLMDATLFPWQGRYWMLAGWHSYWLRAYYATHPLGPWRAHWMPWARLYNKKNVRPGGKPVVVDGALIRFAQDNRGGYGKQLQAMQITCLNRLWYSERAYMSEPILKPNGEGWYSQRMHHLDLHPSRDGWIGFIDGCN